jgi:hypothetical protein
VSAVDVDFTDTCQLTSPTASAKPCRMIQIRVQTPSSCRQGRAGPTVTNVSSVISSMA